MLGSLPQPARIPTADDEEIWSRCDGTLSGRTTIEGHARSSSWHCISRGSGAVPPSIREIDQLTDSIGVGDFDITLNASRGPNAYYDAGDASDLRAMHSWSHPVSTNSSGQVRRLRIRIGENTPHNFSLGRVVGNTECMVRRRVASEK